MFMAGGIAWFACNHLSVTFTHSLTHRVFWRSDNPALIKTVHTGNYVIFRHFVPAPLNRVTQLIKRVGCSSGEVLAVDAQDDYFCNGRYLGRAKHKTLRGEPLTPFRYNGVVPPEMLFLIGDHRDSYDSRYMGFIETKDIREIAWAIY